MEDNLRAPACGSPAGLRRQSPAAPVSPPQLLDAMQAEWRRRVTKNCLSSRLPVSCVILDKKRHVSELQIPCLGRIPLMTSKGTILRSIRVSYKWFSPEAWGKLNLWLKEQKPLFTVTLLPEPCFYLTVSVLRNLKTSPCTASHCPRLQSPAAVPARTLPEALQHCSGGFVTFPCTFF